MRFNYNLYRPKKFVTDVRKTNSSYFRAKDVTVTPLTKIGDAAKLHHEQSVGRAPTLSRKLRPGQLAQAMRNRRQRVMVQNASQPSRVAVHIHSGTHPTPLHRSHQSTKAFSIIALLRRGSKRVLAIGGSAAPMKPLALGLIVLATGAGIGSAQIVSNSSTQSSPAAQPPHRTLGKRHSRQQSTPTAHKLVAAPTYWSSPASSVADNSQSSVRTSRGYLDSPAAHLQQRSSAPPTHALPVPSNSMTTPTNLSASAAANLQVPQSNTAISQPSSAAGGQSNSTQTSPASQQQSAPAGQTATAAPSPPSSTSAGDPSYPNAGYIDNQLLNQNVPAAGP